MVFILFERFTIKQFVFDVLEKLVDVETKCSVLRKRFEPSVCYYWFDKAGQDSSAQFAGIKLEALVGDVVPVPAGRDWGVAEIAPRSSGHRTEIE